MKLPVIDRNVFHAVRVQGLQLMGFHSSIPALPIVKPFLSLPASANPTNCVQTPMRNKDDWSLVLFFPSHNSFFVDSHNTLLHNFDLKLDHSQSPVWNGTVLGVERTDTDWFAADAYVIGGESLLHLPFTKRREHLQWLQATWMPKLKLVDEMKGCKGKRTWNPDASALT